MRRALTMLVGSFGRVSRIRRSRSRAGLEAHPTVVRATALPGGRRVLQNSPLNSPLNSPQPPKNRQNGESAFKTPLPELTQTVDSKEVTSMKKPAAKTRIHHPANGGDKRGDKPQEAAQSRALASVATAVAGLSLLAFRYWGCISIKNVGWARSANIAAAQKRDIFSQKQG